jgi:hypothetical protein
MANPLTPDPPATDSSAIVDQTSLGTAGFDKLDVLDKIFAQLVTLIGSLQGAAASQANRLQFYTAWQSSYTQRLNEIPTFTDGDGSVLGTTGTNSTSFSKLRADANNENSAFSTAIQGNRSTVQDDATSLQSAVSQTNDAVNQQSDMATAIIQQFGTILSSIFTPSS